MSRGGHLLQGISTNKQNETIWPNPEPTAFFGGDNKHSKSPYICIQSLILSLYPNRIQSSWCTYLSLTFTIKIKQMYTIPMDPMGIGKMMTTALRSQHQISCKVYRYRIQLQRSLRLAAKCLGGQVINKPLWHPSILIHSGSGILRFPGLWHNHCM